MNPMCDRLCLAAALLLAVIVPAMAAPDTARLIVPGQRIGHLRLGPSGADELRHLPKPAVSDAGMSQTERVWVSKGHKHGRRETLFVHTVSNGALGVRPLDGLTIDEIRVTSPWFHTRHGVSTGSAWRVVRRRYPRLRRVSPGLYDAASQGIGFEFALQGDVPARCVAIIVHTPGAAHLTTAGQVRSLLREQGR